MRYCTATTHAWVTLTRDFQICRECHETVVANDGAGATERAIAHAGRSSDDILATAQRGEIIALTGPGSLLDALTREAAA